MRKRGLVLFVLILLFGGLFSAVGDIGVQEHTGAVRWSDGELIPSFYTTWEIYEFSNSQLLIYVKNSIASLDDITSEVIDYSGINGLTGADILSGSLVSVDNDLIVFDNVLGKDGSQEFRLNSTGISVDQDTNHVWVVNLTDSNGNKSSHTLNLTIKNDSLAPRVDSVSPNSFVFVKNESFNIVLDYTEDESGLNNSTLLYRDNNDYFAGVGVVKGTISSTCDSNQCTFTFNPNGNMDLANDFNYFDSYFKLTDKAGNINNSYYYHLFVDDEDPVIGLNSPASNILVNVNNYNFNYNMSDNSFDATGKGGFDPQVNCSLYFVNASGTTYVDSREDPNDVNGVDLVADLSSVPDDNYTWYIECVDDAERSVKSDDTRVFVLDRFGPLFSLTAPLPEGEVIANGTLIEFDVTDMPSGVNVVNYSSTDGFSGILSSPYQVDTSGWTTGLRWLYLTATDNAGNSNSENYYYKIDASAPVINLDFPTNSGITNGVVRFTAIDEYSSQFDCVLTVDVDNYPIINVNNNTQEVYDISAYGDDNYTWYVTCIDNVGNIGVSSIQSLILDKTPPTVTLDYPVNVDPYDVSNIYTNGVSDFNYTASDDNVLDSCVLYVNGNEVATNNGNDFNYDFSGLGAQNDPYTWEVKCNDSANNWGNASGYVYYDDKDPVISNVANSSITSSSATITWDVNEICENTVYSGTNISNLAPIPDDVFSTTADVVVSGLSASTLYYFVVQSCDQFNNCINSTDYNFTTTSTPAGPSGGGGSSHRYACYIDADCTEEKVCVNHQCVVPIQEGGSCEPAWKCTWSDCIDSKKTKTCVDVRECSEDFVVEEVCEDTGGSGDIVIEPLTGEIEGVGIKETSGGDDGSNMITGAAVGLGDRIKDNILPIIAVLAIAVLVGLVAWKKEAVKSGIGKIKNYKSNKGKREEEAIRDKLRQQGIIK